MINEDNTISLVSDNGKVKNYQVLITFEVANNLYVVYTDNELDEEGFTKTYAGIYHEEKGKKSLLPVETDEEWTLIEKLLKNLEKNNKGVNNEE